MSKQMRAIMKNWRKSVIQEQVTNVGQLRATLARALQVKKGEVRKDAIKNTAADLVLDVIPGGATIKNVFDLAKSFYTLPDEKKTNTGLDYLNVDDDVSAVVDDRVENQFLQDTLSSIKDLDDSYPLEDLDMTTRLSNFIKEKYNQTKVDKEQ